MPSPRAVLIDIEEFNLSPDESHMLHGVRLSGETKSQKTVEDLKDSSTEDTMPNVLFASVDNHETQESSENISANIVDETLAEVKIESKKKISQKKKKK